MTPDMLDKLARFREKALARGVPADDVERWIGTARPCARLDTKGEGPWVGRLGGPVMLPPDAPDPWCRLAAVVDLAALPPGATDLPRPSDGRLLLFAEPNFELIDQGSLGSALHIPAGTPVEERPDVDPEPGSQTYDMEYPEGPLHLTADVSLPFHSEVLDPGPPAVSKPLEGHPHAAELLDAWLEIPQDVVFPGLQLGGYSRDEELRWDPAVSAGWEAARAEAREELPSADTPVHPEDWVCLAQWWHDIDGLEAAMFSWSIARQDLAAGRFDRVYATMTFNP